MQTDCDENFQTGSQQYIKKKSELREAQQRFFEENLNEGDIFQEQFQKRHEDQTWIWNSLSKISQPILEEKEIPKEENIENEEDKITVMTHNEYLKNLLLKEDKEKKKPELKNTGKVVEPGIVLGKIEGYLDYILRCSQNNYNHFNKKKKKERNRSDKKNGNKTRKRSKKKEKKFESIKEIVKPEISKESEAKPKILDKGNILNIGELLNPEIDKK
jgi:hypothetical protein